MYNQTLTCTLCNGSFGTPGTSGFYTNRINYGLNIIMDNLPASVYNVVKEYQTVLPLKNYTQPLAYLCDKMIDTMLILTGADGTFVHVGYMYSRHTKHTHPL
ncbi:DUF929 family protein [Ferroplasma acidiphilum]|uniref:DUF929 family protein n=1 Tax=Ferroplasma acidiphilum TaxID=74969 RepID=UPI0035A15EC8